MILISLVSGLSLINRDNCVNMTLKSSTVTQKNHTYFCEIRSAKCDTHAQFRKVLCRWSFWSRIRRTNVDTKSIKSHYKMVFKILILILRPVLWKFSRIAQYSNNNCDFFINAVYFKAVSWIPLRRADHSSRGVLLTVVSRVWSINFVNEGDPSHWGLSRQKQTKKQMKH
jgi:hypothetical protein